MKREKPVCADCGSDEILFDAYVSWNPVIGQYEIVNVSDKPIICEGKCDGGETSIEWVTDT